MLLAVASIPVHGQDLLARQAPVDRKMAAVDTIMLRNIAAREEAESPATDLYAGWDNRYAHRATELPEHYKIDLRHFCMPTTSRVITSNFGSRWGRQHKGLDIKVYIGDTIRAAFSGKVRIVRYEGGGYGKYIVIRHNNGLETIYGHLSKQLVDENQEVRAGDVIGLGGNTGRSTGSHLHFETRLCGVALNPALMFDFREQDVTGDYYAFDRSTYDWSSDVCSSDLEHAERRTALLTHPTRATTMPPTTALRLVLPIRCSITRLRRVRRSRQYQGSSVFQSTRFASSTTSRRPCVSVPVRSCAIHNNRTLP